MKSVLLVFKLVMSLVYIAIGLTFVFNPSSMGSFIPAQYMPVLGLVLIIYGVFRAYRAYVVERKN